MKAATWESLSGRKAGWSKSRILNLNSSVLSLGELTAILKLPALSRNHIFRKADNILKMKHVLGSGYSNKLILILLILLGITPYQV